MNDPIRKIRKSRVLESLSIMKGLKLTLPRCYFNFSFDLKRSKSFRDFFLVAVNLGQIKPVRQLVHLLKRENKKKVY